MSKKSLESDVLREVFAAMGQHFEWDTDVDVLIVGGAALAACHLGEPRWIAT